MQINAFLGIDYEAPSDIGKMMDKADRGALKCGTQLAFFMYYYTSELTWTAHIKAFSDKQVALFTNKLTSQLIYRFWNIYGQ